VVATSLRNLGLASFSIRNLHCVRAKVKDVPASNMCKVHCYAEIALKMHMSYENTSCTQCRWCRQLSLDLWSQNFLIITLRFIHIRLNAFFIFVSYIGLSVITTTINPTPKYGCVSPPDVTLQPNARGASYCLQRQASGDDHHSYLKE